MYHFNTKALLSVQGQLDLTQVKFSDQVHSIFDICTSYSKVGKFYSNQILSPHLLLTDIKTEN